MAGELPDSERLVREVESLRQRVTELESESLDVTRTLAETKARLKECQDGFLTLMETIQEMVSRLRPDSTYVYVSPACTRLFGYLPEDLIGRKAYDFIHPEDVSTVMAAAHRTLETGTPDAGEYRHLTKDGVCVWVSTTWRVIAGSQIDEPKEIVCVVRDIAARKQSEEALRASEERFRFAALCCSDFIYDRNLGTGRALFFGGVDECLGYAPGDFPRTLAGWMEQIHPGDLSRVMEAIRSSFERGDRYDLEYRLRRSDGAYADWWDRGIVLADVRGNPVRNIGAAQDVTERKRVEEALRESSSRYRAFFEHGPDGVVILDPETARFIEFNDRACQQLGYSREEFGRLQVFDIEAAETADETFVHIQNIVREGHDDFETRQRTKQGEIRDVHVTAQIIEAGGHTTYHCVWRDITERKRAAEALLKTERHLRSVIEASPVLLWELDSAGSILLSEGNALAQLGLKPGELVGRSVFEFSRDDVEALALIRRGLAGEKFTADVSVGGRYWQNHYIPRRDDHGNVVDLIGISTDITERKQAELEKQLILDLSLDLICIAGVDGYFKYVNPAWERFLGYSREELLSKPFLAFIHPEDHGKNDAEVEKLTKGELTIGFENRHIHKDGTLRTISWVAQIHPGTDLLFCMGHDITDRKRDEEALRKSYDLLDTTFDTLNDAVFILDEKSVVVDCNRAASQIFGYRQDEMQGQTTAFLHIDESVLAEFRQQLYSAIEAKGRLDQFEFRMKRRDGTIFATEHSVLPLANVQSRRWGWVSVVRDITERKRAEDALNANHEQLRALASDLAQVEEQERRRIAAYLHDEICQLLAAVRVKLGAWKARNPSMNAPELLSDIERTIDQTIDDTRLVTYELSPPILFELGLGPALECLGERLCEEHGIVFEFRDEGQTKSLSEGLASALYRIARELLMNVVKHAQAKHLSVSVALMADAVQVVVEDDGKGFNVSQRTGEVLRTGEHFGLFGIRERILYFGGSLKLDSTPGRGTRATVAVPLDKPVVTRKGDLT